VVAWNTVPHFCLGKNVVEESADSKGLTPFRRTPCIWIAPYYLATKSCYVLLLCKLADKYLCNSTQSETCIHCNLLFSSQGGDSSHQSLVIETIELLLNLCLTKEPDNCEQPNVVHFHPPHFFHLSFPFNFHDLHPAEVRIPKLLQKPLTCLTS
jgi:hypothetical protein